jgi:hypothetical protein
MAWLLQEFFMSQLLIFKVRVKIYHEGLTFKGIPRKSVTSQ